jgi:hypothetical protein
MKLKEAQAEETTRNNNFATESSADVLRELVSHLRRNRTQLREEWARRIRDARLLTAMSDDEIFSEATSVYDNYVEVLETGSVEALQAYARNLSGLSCCCATCWPAPYSRSIRKTLICSTACSTPTSLQPIG